MVRLRTMPVVFVVAAVVLAALGVSLISDLVRLGGTPAPVPRVGPEVPVTATNRLLQPSNNSPGVLADPTEPDFVVVANRLDARDFSCALQVSGDGGASWVGAQPVPKLPPGADKCYGPEVAFERDGTLHYLFVGLTDVGNRPVGAYITTSEDRARTFSAPRQVLGPLNFAVRMAVDPAGRLHLVWLHASSEPNLGGFGAGSNPILAAYSDDGGRKFSDPVQVSDPKRARVVAPALVLGSAGAVHVAYYDLQEDARDYLGLDGPTWDGSWSVVMSTSSDRGRSFGAGAVIDDAVTPPERPMLIFTMAPPAFAVDDTRMCAAWTDGRNGDPDVMLRCSQDGGRSWSPMQRLNDDPVGNGKRQYLPRLAVALGGRIDAVFLDRRRGGTNITNDTFYTFSSDGGRSFARNRRLTTQDSFATIGARYAGPSAAGQYEFGGRLGLLSLRSSVIAAWPDTRYSPDGTGQDIVATTIRFPAGGQPGWARVLGGALLVLGAGTIFVGARRRQAAGAADAGEKALLGATAGGRGDPGTRPPRPLIRWLAGVGVVATAIAVVWVAAPEGTSASMPPSPPVVEVTQTEYRFDYVPPTRAGRIVFRVHNGGQVGHRFGVFPLPEDMPPIDEQLRGTVRRTINPVVDVPRQKEMAPGDTESFALDLEPGRRYAFLCLLTTPKGELHADLGMNTEFRAGGKDATPPTVASSAPGQATTSQVPTSPASSPPTGSS